MISSLGSRIGNKRGVNKPPEPVDVSGIVTSGLIVHLDASNPSSYPGSGTTWTDLTGTGNNGTLTGGPTFSALGGGCFDFDGTNDSVVIAHNSALSAKTTASITLQTWVRFDVLEARGFIGKLSSSFAFDGYIVSCDVGGILRATTNGTGVDKRHTTSPTAVFTANVWYFATFITRISGLANSTKMYVNTNLVYQGAHGTDGYNESNPLRLGMGYYDGDYLNGKIGAFYFYTRELSSTEITQNFNNTKARYGY